VQNIDMIRVQRFVVAALVAAALTRLAMHQSPKELT
jgi:hypothetical protein